MAAVTATTALTGAGQVDMSLLNELYEEIESRPPAIEARKLLIQQCLEAGWNEAARDAVNALLRLIPGDEEANKWAKILFSNDAQPSSNSTSSPIIPGSWLKLSEDTEVASLELLQGYQKLRADSKRLHREISILRNLATYRDPSVSNITPAHARLDSHIKNLSRLADGQVSTVIRVQQLKSTRSVARNMEADPTKAVDIAILDLKNLVQWLSSPSQATQMDSDGLREAVVKRVEVLSAALPDKLKIYAKTAQMHVEHEVLQRSYVCDETMYGDLVVDIPRDNFLVTDDGYAWDMEELSQAITSNGGVMRNPLSRQMFTTHDIRAIVQHPLGKNLAALQIEQSKLSQGVRPKTIEEMEKIAEVLLADMSSDQMESRLVIDAFMAYMATLPEEEQKALENLRVPARDSHTGQGFDTTIGEAVLDAKSNRVCFHKSGDLLKQAATYLKKKP